MKILVLFANGFEEIEAVTVVNILRRAGLDVTTAGLISSMVEGSHDMKFMADTKISDINPDTFDALVLPGGPGYKNFANSNTVINLIKTYNKKNKYIAAICASPSVLAKAGVLEDKIATIYPGMERELPKPRDAKVIVAGNIVTSRSPGTAMEFALKLAELFAGKQTANRVREIIAMH